MRYPLVPMLTRRGPAIREHGQILVLFALALVAILWMVRLLIDGASAVTLRRAMQDASDAAALAGANLLTGRTCSPELIAPGGDVRTSVEASLTANNWSADRASVIITCPDGWGGAAVEVELRSTGGGMFFGAMNIGVDSTAVNGEFATGVTSVITLHNSRCNSFYLNGTVNLTFQGGVHVNSGARGGQGGCTPSEAAAIGKGNSSIVRLANDSVMRVRGSWKDVNVAPAPVTGTILPDPFIGLDEPSDGTSPFTGLATNPPIDAQKYTRCVDVPYQSPIYGEYDADGNGVIEGPVDYNEDGVVTQYDWDGDGVPGEPLAGIDWEAGLRPVLGGPDPLLEPDLVAYLNSLTVVNGDIVNTIDGVPPDGITFGDGVIDFYETELNDDLDGDGAVDIGIVGYETLYRRECRDLFAWIMSPGVYTTTIPSPSAGNYLVFMPGVYIFQNQPVQNRGGAICTLPTTNPLDPSGTWSYGDVGALCGATTGALDAWKAACGTLQQQREGAPRCGAMLHWTGFTTCNRSNPPTLFGFQGNAETRMRPYLSGAADGTELEKYDGFLLWFDRNHAAEPGCVANLRGGGTSLFSGTIYGATTNVSMAGGGTGAAGAVTLQMVVQNIEFKGGSIFNFEYDADELSRYYAYGLVE